MIPVRQSTAFEFSIGPVLDADGVAVTDCTASDFKLKKTTGNFAALNGSATVTHVSAGTYDVVLTTSDTDTVGLATVAIDDTVNACAPVRMQVIEEAIYDAMYAASANAFSGAAGATTLTALASGSITAAVIATDAIDADAIADNAIDAGAIATGAITSAKFAAGAIDAAAIANGAIDAATFAADVDAEILSYLVDDATRIDASALNTASTAIGSNGSGLTEAGGDGDHLTAINLPNQTMDITGNITGNLTGSVGSVTGAVGSVTGNVGGNVTGSVGSVVGAVGSVTGNVGGNVTGSVGSLATQAKADVNTEVVDAIATDTYAEPSAVPSATSSLKDKINWMFSLLRNKRTQTATTETLFRDDGSTTTATSTKSDDETTLTRGEWT